MQAGWLWFYHYSHHPARMCGHPARPTAQRRLAFGGLKVRRHLLRNPASPSGRRGECRQSDAIAHFVRRS